MSDKERIEQLERELAEANKQLERYHDLVRYQRAELHQADLISDEEYGKLLSDSKSVARLENYDDVATDRDRWRKMAADAVLGLCRLIDETDGDVPHKPQPCGVLGHPLCRYHEIISRFNAMKGEKE